MFLLFQFYGVSKVLELSYPLGRGGFSSQYYRGRSNSRVRPCGKVSHKRALNVEAIAKKFTPIWRMKNGFRVTKESDHVVLFTFDNQTNLEQVLNTEPWSFDKHLMVLHRYDKVFDVSEIDFNMVTFWI